LIPPGVSVLASPTMRKLLAVALASLFSLTACSTDAGEYTTQGAREFASTIADPSVVILDVRTPAEFAAGHIEGAINIDAESGRFAEEIKSLDASKTYAIYCRSGRRSALAADVMQGAGFASLYNLDSGLLAWNGPLVNP
jgi:phage shock protein E